jgi:hypothetical protein
MLPPTSESIQRVRSDGRRWDAIRLGDGFCPAPGGAEALVAQFPNGGASEGDERAQRPINPQRTQARDFAEMAKGASPLGVERTSCSK